MELNDLIEVLDTQQNEKSDYLIPSNKLMMYNGNVLMKERMQSEPNYDYEPTRTLHNGIATRLGIPGNYYRFLQAEHLDMLDYNVSELFMRQQSKQVMLRTFENGLQHGIGRALLSDHYKVIDNLDILTATIEAIDDCKFKIGIQSCDITENKMYVRFDVPNAIAELKRNGKVNEMVMAGFILSNSEVGQGTFLVHPRLTVLRCTNGMIVDKGKIAQRHLGSQMDFVGKIEWSQATRQREMALIQSQIRDAVIAYAQPSFLTDILNEISEKGNKELINPSNTVTKIGYHLAFSEERRTQLFDKFIHDGDNTRFGLVQAVTAMAHDELTDPDTRFQLESASLPLLDIVTQIDEERRN